MREMEDDEEGSGGWRGDMESSYGSTWTHGATSSTNSIDFHVGKKFPIV
jgi:hypothetical protein